tara:strand:+ start:147 stop:629 length:483 start_codon:yes stop_codon:yes gene_type:complete
MGVLTSYYSVPQDPMFGISHENIVSRLTRRNWKTKASTRLHPDGPVYIFINRGERKVSGRKTFVYTVKGTIVDKQQGYYRRDFPNLREALSYANGEDGGDLSQETLAAESPRDYPIPLGPEVTISGMSMVKGRRVPDWSIQLREPAVSSNIELPKQTKED